MGMLASPLALHANAYPTPSAEKWAARANEEMQASVARREGYEKLKQTKLTQAQKDREARKAKRRADESKFKARQAQLKAQQDREREDRLKNRKAALKKIE